MSCFKVCLTVFWLCDDHYFSSTHHNRGVAWSGALHSAIDARRSSILSFSSARARPPPAAVRSHRQPSADRVKLRFRKRSAARRCSSPPLDVSRLRPSPLSTRLATRQRLERHTPGHRRRTSRRQPRRTRAAASCSSNFNQTRARRRLDHTAASAARNTRCQRLL